MKKIILSSSFAIAASIGAVNATPLFETSELGTQQKIIGLQLGEENSKEDLILELCCGYMPSYMSLEDNLMDKSEQDKNGVIQKWRKKNLESKKKKAQKEEMKEQKKTESSKQEKEKLPKS